MKITEWVGTILMCAVVYWRAPRPCWGVLLFTGLPIWVVDLSRSAESIIGYIPAHRWIFLVGSLCAGLAWASMLFFALHLYKRRIGRIYTSVGERVFLSHARFIAQATILVSVYFLLHGFLSF